MVCTAVCALLISLVSDKGDPPQIEAKGEKILSGVRKACEKRPVPFYAMEKLVDEVEAELNAAMENEIASTRIGEMVMRRLKKIDEVAYVRFASVYRRFKDINTFMEELELLLQEQKHKEADH